MEETAYLALLLQTAEEVEVTEQLQDQQEEVAAAALATLRLAALARLGKETMAGRDLLATALVVMAVAAAVRALWGKRAQTPRQEMAGMVVLLPLEQDLA
jgi:hypothetical protein